MNFAPFPVQDGWVSAAKAPDDTPKKEIKAKNLIKAMRQYPDIRPDQTVMKAISVALTPKEDMPY